MSQDIKPKRVVSRQTKALFIAFGAASIASLCIVYTDEPDGATSYANRANPAVRNVTPAQPAK